MDSFLFRFGFETPAQHRNNEARGWDDEDSQAVFIEGPSADAALEWGREIAEQFVRNLWSADGGSGPSWKESQFAHWIETDPDTIANTRAFGVPRVGIGEHPGFPLPAKPILVEAPLTRSIPVYVSLALVTIAAGLASRAYPDALPEFVARYAGDTLWAAMVFWVLALVWRRSRTAFIAAASLAIAIATEVSQLYHAPWIDSIRATRFVGLILGSGFLWSDLVCYAAGIAIAAGCDTLLIARNKSQ